MDKQHRQGPFLDETQSQEYELDLGKLSAELRQIKLFIIADRDSKNQYAILIKWGNEIIYRNENVSAYDRIAELLKDRKYCIEMTDNKLTLNFSGEDFV